LKIEIYAPNATDSLHLRDVVREMKRRGPPKLRAIEEGGVWHALEGSHRIKAAVHLRLPVILLRQKKRNRITTDVLDRKASVKEILKTLMSEWRGSRPRYTVEAEIR
jgi:hypothetical protein